ncbi:MAG: glycosyltransferase family 1 protein [Subdoligranulum sp.]|nr:glycosyltransferase family 1 protein [Subdoligranulum sp.]
MIGHIARFVPQKNTLFLIDIFAEIAKKEPRAFLVLVGDGELREPALQKLENLGLQEKALWLGYQKDIPPLYHAIDAFLLPSLYEGLPIVGVEAQMNGLPVIYSSEITSEAAVCDLARFVSLNDSPRRWADVVLNAIESNQNRKGRKQEILNAGMDSEREGKRLTEYYIMLQSA